MLEDYEINRFLTLSTVEFNMYDCNSILKQYNFKDTCTNNTMNKSCKCKQEFFLSSMLLVFVSLMRFLGPSGFTTENQFIETDKHGSITTFKYDYKDCIYFILHLLDFSYILIVKGFVIKRKVPEMILNLGFFLS